MIKWNNGLIMPNSFLKVLLTHWSPQHSPLIDSEGITSITSTQPVLTQ